MSKEHDRWLEYLDDGDIKQLFIEGLHWSRTRRKAITVEVESQSITVTPVAEYRGIVVWVADGLPSGRVQRIVDAQVMKESRERLVIFRNRERQQWRWPMTADADGRGTVRLVTHEHIVGRSTQSLLQRLDFIRIGMNEEPTVVEMLGLLRRAFDADQVTRAFYRRFLEEHEALLDSIEGISSQDDQEWYGSLLMNRLMFIYFVQWKGFMDDNRDYLGDRLRRVRAKQGPDHFYSFYKDLLVPLFHEGLGSHDPKYESSIARDLIGRVPFVNGGIFARHELEERYDIQIPDAAFERILAFFNAYNWHLDDRPSGSPTEINPDILGYIFEQFINNKEKGAYYTKEDVTDYMTTNTVTAVFLDRLVAATGVNPWLRLVAEPDRYIWEALHFGLGDDDHAILGGPPTDGRPSRWDDSTHEALGLPGETYWETADRWDRYAHLRDGLSSGRVASVGEAIGANIDLEALAVDVIDALDSPSDVLAAWEVLSNLRVLDPTCGSGAFLFAALKRMKALYSAVLDAARLHAATASSAGLDSLIDRVGMHSSQDYFILKHAAQNNLFGVDLMREATEIARLRLFLKLISAVDKFEDVEPLPDLEFNIKSGNLLVGFTTRASIDGSASTFEAVEEIEAIKVRVDELAWLWDEFAAYQESGDHERVADLKVALLDQTDALRPRLDELFYAGAPSTHQRGGFDAWVHRSSPFHWFLEFPRVFADGGFDSIVGNPPYIPVRRVDYDVSGLQTSECPDIYAMCMERAGIVTREDGRYAMIVMTNMCFGGEYQPLRDFMTGRFPSRWVSSFGRIPASLFTNETRVRNSIILAGPGERQLQATRLHRWFQDFRPYLLPTMTYSTVPDRRAVSSWPFLAVPAVAEALWSSQGRVEASTTRVRGASGYDAKTKDGGLEVQGPYALNFKTTAYNYLPVFIDIPPKLDEAGNEVRQTKLSTLWFRKKRHRDLALTLAVSKWGFAWWAMYGDDFDLTGGLLVSLPVDLDAVPLELADRLTGLVPDLRRAMKANKTMKKNKGLIFNWYLPGCRDVTDQLDALWAEYFGGRHLLAPLQLQYFGTVKTDLSEDGDDGAD